ncbi:MAG TPA: ABC transporter ATP-binding protein, partial [Myxococcota bacterium]
GLDPAQIVAMRGLIRGLKEKHTVLLSSHILAEITHTADRILVLHGGKIVAEGTEGDLVGSVVPRVEVVGRGDVAVVDRVVRAVAGVVDVDVSGAADGLVHARFTGDGSVREAVVAALVGAGVGVRSVVDRESGLEGLFLKLTGGAA